MLAKPFWPVVEYVVNYEYIVTTLCENRDKPEMHCNGKCYLSKELAKEAGTTDKNPFGKSSKSEIPQVIIAERLDEFIFSKKIPQATKDSIGEKPEMVPFLFVSKILHPPQTA